MDQVLPKMATDSASFLQQGTDQVKVRERDFVRLWEGTTRRRSLAERMFLDGTEVWTNTFR